MVAAKIPRKIYIISKYRMSLSGFHFSTSFLYRIYIFCFNVKEILCGNIRKNYITVTKLDLNKPNKIILSDK